MRYGIDASNLRSGGGVHHLLRILENSGNSLGSDMHIIVWGSSALCERIVRREGITLTVVPDLDTSPLRRLFWQFRQLPNLAGSSCDVLFAPGGLAGNHSVPTVAMCRNMLPFELAEARRYGASYMFARLLFLRVLQARTFRCADGAIFLSDYARERVSAQIGDLRARTALIAHGVEQRFRSEPRLQRPLEKFTLARPFRLLYVSIVDVYKHQWHVAAAVADLRRKGMPVALDMVGPAYPPALRRLHASLKKLDPTGACIQYSGAVAYSELHHRYHDADGFIFASTCENMPNVLLEAMAAGLPMACSERRPMTDILGEGGVYFDPMRPESISRAVASMVRDADKRTHAAHSAYERAADYTWGRCAAETFCFLDECAGMKTESEPQLRSVDTNEKKPV